MKYKIIINETETLCDKVTVDGFDYYISDELPKQNDVVITAVGNIHYIKDDSKDFIEYVSKLGKVLIATNNPNIDIPKVVDEVAKEAERDWIYKEHGFEQGYNPQRCIDGAIQKPKFINGYIKGYNKSQETHPYSEADMFDFGEWCENLQRDNKDIRRNNPDITRKELLEIWKSRRTITIHAV